MARVHDRITPELAEFCSAQHLFFVATAPSGSDGHVNVSPKGYDTFAVLDSATVAYLDLTGSGAETVAHLRDNGRITLMFCSFDGSPNIVRFHGRGRVVARGDEEFDELAAAFDDRPGARAVVVVDVTRVSSSCGFAVPRFDYVGERPTLDEWASHRSDDELVAYRATKNAVSIDGLPAVES